MSKVISGAREQKIVDLLDRAHRAARGLHELGVQRGDAVALLLRNDFAFFEAARAAGRLGAYSVPINWHYSADEVGYILRDSGAKALVAHADLLRGVAEGVPEGLPVFVVETPEEIRESYGIRAGDAALSPQDSGWDALCAAHEPQPEGAARAPGSMIYTSGTTGRPKGVRRRGGGGGGQGRAPATLLVATQVFGMSRDMVTVITGPMYHSAPNAYGAGALAFGGTVIMQPRFDPEEMLALVEQHRVTHLHMVPTMFVRLLRLPEEVRARHDLSSLRFVVHAAAPCPPDIKRQMIEWWGPVIYEYYGATETGPVVFCDSAGWLAHPGTVGKALEGSEVRILDDDGAELPTGEPGEVFCRNRGLGDFTYHGDDDKRAAAEKQGLFTVGDIGYLDADGYLYLCDRKRDMVISGGVNIYPAEIEAELLKLEGVRDCAVFGIPDEEYGESLACFVEPEPGANLTPDDVRQFLRARKARYMVPKLVELRDSLPREDSGKIFKRKLRDPYWEKAGRSI